MPWVVGIDEAGYGPNLGPLVQAAAAFELPDDDTAGWNTLKSQARRMSDDDNGQLIIDDSKKVYTSRNGFSKLETTVLSALQLKQAMSFHDLLIDHLSNERWLAELFEEFWFDAGMSIPIEASIPTMTLPVGMLTARITATPEFNRILEQSGSKATVLTMGLIQLIRHAMQTLPGYGPVLFICDKQGGRNFYGPMLASAFPDGWVMPVKETADESWYRVESLSRPVELVFRPRADGDSISVALASMACKYLREVCMMQWNAYWKTHLPEIQPTAGYPVDAKRFYTEIEPIMGKLGISRESVWRNK